MCDFTFISRNGRRVNGWALANPARSDVGARACGSNSLHARKTSLLVRTGIFHEERHKTPENGAEDSGSIGPNREMSLQMSLLAGNSRLDTAYRSTEWRTTFLGKFGNLGRNYLRVSREIGRIPLLTGLGGSVELRDSCPFHSKR